MSSSPLDVSQRGRVLCGFNGVLQCNGRLGVGITSTASFCL